MKKITITFDVLDENSESVLINAENYDIPISKDFIKEHEALSVDEVDKYCRENDAVFIIDCEEIKHSNKWEIGGLMYSPNDLKALIKGKERSLEDWFIELREAHQDRDTKKFDEVMSNIRELLKEKK